MNLRGKPTFSVISPSTHSWVIMGREHRHGRQRANDGHDMGSR